MRKVLVVGLVVVLTAVCVSPAAAEDDGPELTVVTEMSLVSKYIWNGIKLSDDCLQPCITVCYGDFALLVLGTIELTNVNHYPGHSDTMGDMTEIDTMALYSFSPIDDVTCGIGLIRYDFPNTDFKSTTDFYASVAVDCLLSPSVTLYRDMDEMQGSFYVEFGLAQTVWEFAGEECSGSVDLGGVLIYGNREMRQINYGYHDAGLICYELSLCVPLDVRGFTVTPSMNFTRIIEGQIVDNLGDDTHFWGGLTVSYTF